LLVLLFFSSSSISTDHLESLSQTDVWPQWWLPLFKIFAIL
jgi:hypothetical protein